MVVLKKRDSTNRIRIYQKRHLVNHLNRIDLLSFGRCKRAISPIEIKIYHKRHLPNYPIKIDFLSFRAAEMELVGTTFE